MNIFINILEAIMGKRTIRIEPSAPVRMFWKKPEHGEPGKRLKYLTTNDLDSDGKLKKNYLAERAQRKKEREKENEYFFWTD